jgi:hypothetical protein
MSEQSVIARPGGYFYLAGNWDIFRSLTSEKRARHDVHVPIGIDTRAA